MSNPGLIELLPQKAMRSGFRDREVRTVAEFVADRPFADVKRTMVSNMGVIQAQHVDGWKLGVKRIG